MSIPSILVDASSSSKSVVSKSEGRPALIQTYEGHNDSVFCVAFFQDEQRLVTGSRDEGVRVWNRETGAQIGDALEGHTRVVLAVDVSRDGRTIASGSEDRKVRIWDAETEKLLRTLGHEGAVNLVHISPDSKRVATGSWDVKVRVWDIETGELAFKPIECNRMVRAVNVSPDGRTMASGSVDKTVRIWDVDTEEFLRTLGDEWTVYSVHISPDSKRVASGSADDKLRVWDIKTGELAFKPITCNARVWCVRYSPSGDRIASVADSIQIWNADTAENILSIEGPAHDNLIHSLSLSQNGSHLATCGAFEKTAFVFDITTGEQVAAYEHDDNVLNLAYSPSGRFIATACEDKKAYLWDAPEDPQPTVSIYLVSCTLLLIQCTSRRRYIYALVMPSHH
ncbi:hypothetical protein HYDPIDRAFT_89377 [Hydnomerulius pinastri MD-312]|uniref:WD40 repeat-like protein n=1 Tax=Hydnomerulius pinastri MD-312 TaxID=994086 RepID=A0A0C9WG53_9AGAM|nr:hypothetical protein HYDPIDRAFT_89377 [Hydnomerulius pinastri MD-312]